MTEDNEEKRFSRKKSSIKGPFIQDEDRQPAKKPKAKPEEKPFEEKQEKTAEEAAVSAAATAQPEPQELVTQRRQKGPIELPQPEVEESKKDRKKREKEEKKAKLLQEKESKKREKQEKSDRRKEPVREPGKSIEEKPSDEPVAEKETEEEGGPAPVTPETIEPTASEIPSGPEKEIQNPEEEKQEEVPVPVAGHGEEIPAPAESSRPEVPVQEEELPQPIASESAETPAAEETPIVQNGDHDFKTVEESDLNRPESPEFLEASSETAQAATETGPEEEDRLSAESETRTTEESKKDRKKREKEEKRTQILLAKESKKKEKQEKKSEIKKIPDTDLKRMSTGKLMTKQAPVQLPERLQKEEEEEDSEEGGDENERVSRFSLRKFVTAYRDKQSVMVRQAEIKRFQSALFPRVMARKWQTSITPTMETSTQDVSLPEVPLHLKLGLFFFRNFYAKRIKNEKLEVALRKAKMPYSAIQYYSMISIVAIIIALAGTMAISVVSLLIGGLIWYAYPAMLGIVGLIALVSLNSPQSLVNKRKKDIDSKLPMALAYIATMASADVPVETIMYELGKSFEYGEIAKEAKAISASSRLFGNDIVTALREESKYSPSLKFSEFLQGITSTVTSGGSLKDYFTMKAVQFQSELSTVIRANAESVGVLAESYVTVGVAFPLMLLVILGVMAALSPSGTGGLTLVLYLVVLAIIPAITFGFTFLVSSTVKEVDV